MDREPIIIRDAHGHGNVRYGWINMDGIRFSSLSCRESAEDWTNMYLNIEFLPPHREIVRLRRIE